MEGPPLGPGGEDITWPDQVAPRGRKASSTRKIKPQTSNLALNTYFTEVLSPQKPFSTAPMPSKHILPTAINSKPLFNCPAAFKTRFTDSYHLKPPFQLPRYSQKTVYPLPPPPKAFSNAPMPSKHISGTATTSNHLFKCPHVLETHFT